VVDILLLLLLIIHLKDRKPGSVFHTITHGKNAMGPHASQLIKMKDGKWQCM
jgi:hypothetical protein